MAILLCSLAVTAVVFAQQLKVESVEPACFWGWESGCIIPPRPRPPIPPRPPRPDYTWYQGVAVNKYSLTAEPFYILKIKYGWKTYMYLFMYDRFYGMEETYNRYDWETGTRIFKYRAYDGSVMTLIEGGSTLSGTFKNYIINIQRMGPYPIVMEREMQPLFRQAAGEISKETGMGVQAILETQTSQ